MSDETRPPDEANLDAVVNEVVSEAHLRPDALRPEERDYLKKHALKKPLRVLDIWALGVGVVIAGAYFGWNLGLKDNGPVAMLVASLLVCLLYLTWVLALAELAVALPFAGGPLAFGRRAGDASLGFVMGWSMFLECQFASIAAVMAAGGYVAFLLNPDEPSPYVQLVASLTTVLIFFLLQVWGVKEQSWAMLIMTWGAIVGLLIFAGAAATNFSWQRVWPSPLFPHGQEGKGWKSVLDAVPYALWWLVMIETVALAGEEAHEPHRTVPRGLVWAQLTLIALVVLTCVFACGALDAQQIAVKGDKDISYPLAEVIHHIPLGQSALLTVGFGTIALFGLIASYHGMIYGSSRQLFALGRAGYLPMILGGVHQTRRTPVPSLLACSLITTGFVVANLWFDKAIAVAVLVSTLTGLIWYILAMGCLYALRRREPTLFQSYRAPVYKLLPLIVILLSVFAVYVYSGIDVKVIPLTALFYAAGLGYFWFWGHRRIQQAAPEELAARQTSSAAGEMPAARPRFLPLERLTAGVLLLVVAAVGWMVVVAYWPHWDWLFPLEGEVIFILSLLAAALFLVTVLALLHTRRRP